MTAISGSSFCSFPMLLAVHPSHMQCSRCPDSLALVALHALRELTLDGVLFVRTATNLYNAALGVARAWSSQRRRGAWARGSLATSPVGLTAAIAVVVLRRLPLNSASRSWVCSCSYVASLVDPTPAPDPAWPAKFPSSFGTCCLWLAGARLSGRCSRPAGSSFALTNTLSGLGRDYGTSEQMVGLITGVGVTVAGIVGSLVVPRLIARISPRLLYVSIGTAGALFTLTLITLSRTPSTFTLAVLGENAVQSAAFAVEATIVLATIGEGNPFAATQFGLLLAAPNLPITYMQALDGAVYGVRGLSGALVTDAVLSLGACAIAGLLFRRIQPNQVEASLRRHASSIAASTAHDTV